MFLAACEGSAILLATLTPHRTVSYIGYLIFCVLYSFTITVARWEFRHRRLFCVLQCYLNTYFSAEVAKHLEDDSFGLVFGINTLIALLLQTILTVTVVSEEGLSLTVFEQYTVYAVYFFVLSAIYLVAFIYSLFRRSPINSRLDLANNSMNADWYVT